MSIYINGRFLNQAITGVQRYAYEMTLELLAMDATIEVLVSRNTAIPDAFINRYRVVGTREGTLWEQLDLPSFLKKQSKALLNLCNTAPLRYQHNFVTIHDCSVFRNPSWFSKRFQLWYRFLIPRIAKKAIHLFTVSEFSKKELVAVLQADVNKITVVYPGVQESFATTKSTSLKENIFLHIGTLSNRKNISCIVEAFAKANLVDYKLILCGNQDKHITHHIEFKETINIQHISDCTDDMLAEYLKQARFILCASHYEGFGIPVLEGIYNGAYPILSDIPVFQEWVGSTSYYFNQNSVDSLVKIMQLAAQEQKEITPAIMERFHTNYNYMTNATILWSSIKANLVK
jgi:glycosyltransferase involved in cell wall biosynthesis